MNREKDSAIVYELVTSKYKIAERNRVAKLRFLNEMKNGSVKRRDSAPSKAETEKVEVKKLDLSVPGTPISSRYIASLGGKFKHHNESDSETENEDEKDINADPTNHPKTLNHSILEDSLKKFTAEMEKLQKDNVSHDPLQKYFEESDKNKTYRRDFSEVVSEFSIKKKEPKTIAKVERYFQESDRRSSFKRDFMEVVQTFDPRNPSGREQFTDLKKPGTPISSRLIRVEKLPSAIQTSDIKISNEIVESNINSQVPKMISNGNKSQGDDVMRLKDDDYKPNENGNILKIIEDDDATIEINVAREETSENEKAANSFLSEEKLIDMMQSEPTEEILLVIENDVNEASTGVKENFIEKPKRKKRNDSTSSNISVPGTPVSSRNLPSLRDRTYIDTDDSASEDEEETVSSDVKISELAKEFVNEIEILVQKSFEDDDGQEIVLEELKKITSENVESDDDKKQAKLTTGESNEKLIIHEEQHTKGDSNPDISSNKVEDYFEKSEKEKTFQRTFSEVESFNQVPLDVKQKVENYFKESEQKKSLTRPFSQVVNYIEPKPDIDMLLKPGTPVSSAVVMSMKNKSRPKSIDEDVEVDQETLKGLEVFKKAQDALVEKENFTVDDYFAQSTERNTYRRDFSEVLEELHKSKPTKNPEIEKYFEQSEAQKSYQRTFSEAIQSVPPRVEEILKAEEKVEAPLHYQRSSRASSISSNCSEQSDTEGSKKTKKHGKKYGIDKYFATSLYRTAYTRSSNSRRQSADGELDGATYDLKIVEDEDVFGETDMLRRHEFQHDDETTVTKGPNDVNENQNVHFWRDFLKPYNLNLQTEITITKDDFLNNRTLE
jgi:hypothetical protein